MTCVARSSSKSNWHSLLVLPVVICLLPALAQANSDYYRHVIFDNSLTTDSFFYNNGQTNGQSFLEEKDHRLPVDTKIFLTPPNAIRLQWQSAPGGGWIAEVRAIEGRNRPPGLAGHNLFLWIFAPQPIAAADLPKIVLSTATEGLQVAEIPGRFSGPLDLGKYSGDVPAGRWLQVRIPLSDCHTASIHPFPPEYLQNIIFHQGRGDNVRHTLIVDEIRVDDDPPASAALPAPSRVRAVGYDSHVEIEWDAVEDPALARYVIYRSLDGSDFSPVGIQLPGVHRYEDFLGKADAHAQYKIAASDWRYRQSALSDAASAATYELTDDELLTMLQKACFHEADKRRRFSRITSRGTRNPSRPPA
jgi:exo beta-1,2-glucooligosaccharide sophorohydrolase (non-reducing end)